LAIAVTYAMSGMPDIGT